MLFGQLGMLFEFFILIVNIRNISAWSDGNNNIVFIYLYGAVVFEVFRPLTCLQTFDGVNNQAPFIFMWQYLFLFFFVKPCLFLFRCCYHGEHVVFSILFVFRARSFIQACDLYIYIPSFSFSICRSVWIESLNLWSFLFKPLNFLCVTRNVKME